jgi:glycosyltransferase involved in cell wall biosynthesis
MRRILYLAYHFPPIGGAGVQRNAKFVRYLPDFGYDPVVIAGPGPVADRWTPTDETLVADIRPGTTVRRVQGVAAPPTAGWRGRVERMLMRRSPFSQWWSDGAAREAADVAGDVELVYASLVPYDAAEGALRVARELGKPLVVDLQDPWALDEMWIYPTALHRRADLARMRRVLGAADAVVMNTPESVARVRKAFPELRDRYVISITNGFDAADFEGGEPDRDELFRIVHTGFLHTEDGLRLRRQRRIRRLLGGMYTDVDIATRSHIYLIDAVRRVIEAEPELAGRITIELAGVLTETDRQIAANAPFVQLHGYKSHAETIELMRRADLLFLPMQELRAGERAGITPGKTYDYLGAKTHILAAIPEGDARDLLLASENASVCNPSDTTRLAELIASAFHAREAGAPRGVPRADVTARYERRRLTEDLARVFDTLLGQAVPAQPVAAISDD